MTVRRLALVIAALAVLSGSAACSHHQQYSCGDFIDAFQHQTYQDTGHYATADDLKAAYENPACQ